MVLSILIIGSMAIFTTIIATLAFIPVVDELGYDKSGHWDTASGVAKDSRDKAVAAIIALPIFLIGAIILWMLLAASRQDVISDY